jgi:AcrR family transcriptional regulator
VICVTPARRRNAKGEGDRLRHDIVSAATALISEHGQQGLTLRAVARQAGVTAPAIYGHFDDLADIRRAVVEDAFAQFAAFLALRARDCADPAERLTALCHAYVEFGLSRPQQYSVMFGPAAAPPASRAAKSIEGMPGAEAFSLLLNGIGECLLEVAPTSEPPVEAAMAVWVGLHGYVGLRIAAPDFPWPERDALLDALIQRLAGLRL